MKAVVEEVPESRICRRGCNGGRPQPIGNFYKGGKSANGFQLFQWDCKECTKQDSRTRYSKMPFEVRGRKRKKDTDNPNSTHGLTFADLHPCKACGLRGHYAGDEEKCPKAQPTSLGLGSRGEEWTL